MPETPGTEQEAADAAVRRLVDEHGGTLFSLAHRFCRTVEEAEDLVQEVFLQAFRGWAEFRGDSSEKTWLYRIAARTCQRMHRKRSGEPDRIGSLDVALPFGEPLIAVLTDDQDDVVRRQITAEARERLESAITTLPVEFRMPLILKEIAGFSVREIAAILGLEAGTVRSRVHRARLRLRAAVEEVIPKGSRPAPPPAYDEQTCLDLLDAKQDALDRGVPFRTDVICDRCRSVFASLDLTQRVCRDIGGDALPDGLRDRLIERIRGE